MPFKPTLQIFVEMKLNNEYLNGAFKNMLYQFILFIFMPSYYLDCIITAVATKWSNLMMFSLSFLTF